MKERIIGLDNLLEELNGHILGKSNDAKYVGFATITRRDLEKLKYQIIKPKLEWLAH